CAQDSAPRTGCLPRAWPGRRAWRRATRAPPPRGRDRSSTIRRR
ncbi:MAG: hypothetical protein AVDCRST_MAG67-3626, partial [uncultured Solirubrobacteraceae bacterium]